MATFVGLTSGYPSTWPATLVSTFSLLRTEIAFQTFALTLLLSYGHAMTLLVFAGYIARGIHFL